MDNQALTKTEYNQALDSLYEVALRPLGFKKNGIHYYLVQGDTLMHVQNGWKRGDMTYLAFSKTWMSFHQTQVNKLKVPQFLSRYPYSISAEMLRRQMSKHSTVHDFDYHTNFYDRINRNIGQKDLFVRSRYKHLSLDYALFVIDVIQNEGLNLAAQMTSELLYWSLVKYEAYHPTLYDMHRSDYMMGMKDELKAKLLQEGKPLPSRPISRWDNFWLWRRVKSQPKSLGY